MQCALRFDTDLTQTTIITGASTVIGSEGGAVA